MDDTCVFDFQLFEIKRIIIKYCNKSKRILNNRKKALRNLIKIFRLDFEKSTSFFDLAKVGPRNCHNCTQPCASTFPFAVDSFSTAFQPINLHFYLIHP